MKRQYIVIMIVAAVILLLAGVGVLAYGLSQGGTLPGLSAEPTPSPQTDVEIPTDLKLTPPPSFEEIAEEIRGDYPELADLLENPELGSVYKDFYLAYQQGGEAAALALARQRGILNDKDQIVITLVLDTEESAPLIAELEAEGVIIQSSYGNLISIAIPLALIETQLEAEEPDLILERISNLEHVISLRLPRGASINKKTMPGREANVTMANRWPKLAIMLQPLSNLEQVIGFMVPDRIPLNQKEFLGQGIEATQAYRWHEQGITGQGVKVGVLDGGFAGYRELLGTELPDEVTVELFGDPYNFDVEPHGTACAEIIHEMAPDAELYLAYYNLSEEAALGEAIEWLISQDVDIISNSTGRIGATPLNGTGPFADLVNQAHEAGIFWVNLAGNSATDHYRGKFNDSDGDNFHEFAPDQQVLPVQTFANTPFSVILSWDDWDRVDQDYAFHVVDQEGNIEFTSDDLQNDQIGQEPLEFILHTTGFEEDTVVLLAISNPAGKARGEATFDLFVRDALLPGDFVSGETSLWSPGDAEQAFTVGAVHWSDYKLEPYSSHGPTNDGRIKPDIVAPDAVDSAAYAPESFPGTSAATPHVAGAAALVLQAFPDFSPDDIATFLSERAIDMGKPGKDNAFGAGRLNLGDGPDETQIAETEEPTPESTGEPTSEPTEAPIPEPTEEPPGEEEDESNFLTLIIITGLCLLCLGSLMVLILVAAGAFFLMRR